MAWQQKQLQTDCATCLRRDGGGWPPWHPLHAEQQGVILHPPALQQPGVTSGLPPQAAVAAAAQPQSKVGGQEVQVLHSIGRRCQASWDLSAWRLPCTASLVLATRPLQQCSWAAQRSVELGSSMQCMYARALHAG